MQLATRKPIEYQFVPYSEQATFLDYAFQQYEFETIWLIRNFKDQQNVRTHIPCMTIFYDECGDFEEYVKMRTSYEMFDDEFEYMTLRDITRGEEFHEKWRNNYDYFMADLYNTYDYHNICFREIAYGKPRIINMPLCGVW